MEKEIEVAAKWWADQLRTKPKHDNGDATQTAMLALATEYQTPVTDIQIDNFQRSLELRLIERCGDSGSHLGVDYGPDTILANASMDAGIETAYRFPVKTNMWVQPGCVKVSCGYRAPIEILYAVDQDSK